MTAKKDLKRRIRERQSRTGESYATARRHVLAGRVGSGIAVEEVIDLDAERERLGLKCPTAIIASLAQRVDPAVALERVRDALRATEGDEDTRALCAAVLRGEKAPLPERSPRWWMEGARRFLARARAGIGGVSDAGTMMALQIDGVMVIARVGWRQTATGAPSAPRLLLFAPEDGPAAALFAIVP